MKTLAELRSELDKMTKDGIALAQKAEKTPEDVRALEKLDKDTDAISAQIAELEGIETRAAKFQAIQAQLQESAGRKTQAAQGLDLSVKEARQYSLLRAIDLTLSGKALDGIEGEYHREIEKRTGRPSKGFYMPGAVAAAGKRALNTTTGVGGLNEVVRYGDFIDILRNQSVCVQMGARVLPGLVGTVSIPKKTAASTFQWVTDGNAPSASNLTLGQIQLTEKHIAGYTDITRSFVKQTSMDAEALVRDDLTQGIALGIDYAALMGTGLSGEPLGLINNTDITQLAIGGSGLTFEEIVQMETTVAAANVVLNSGGYVTNHSVKGDLKTTLKSSVAGASYIWENDMVNGYKALASGQIPAVLGSAGSDSGGALSAIVFGNWSDLIIGTYGELDVLVDPYTGSAAGTVRIAAHQSADVKVRHNGSFVVVDDVAV